MNALFPCRTLGAVLRHCGCLASLKRDESENGAAYPVRVRGHKCRFVISLSIENFANRF